MPDLPAFEVAKNLAGKPSTQGSKSGFDQNHVQKHCAPNGPSNFPDASARNENPSLSRT